MIVNCPFCAARFHMDPQRLEGKRVKIRCVRCREVFQKEFPNAPPASGSTLKVLLAHGDRELCETVSRVLDVEGIEVTVCHEGEEALRRMGEDPPGVIVVDVALPGLFAFEVVEKVRKRTDLKNVKIILLSSVYNRAAYKRFPSSLYGADDYIEKHHIPTDLLSKIYRLAKGNICPGTDLSDSPSPELAAASADSEKDFVDEVNAELQAAEDREVAAESNSEGFEKARRLARIIVSDIALYNQDRVEEGIRTGRFHELMREEIEEGKRLFRERIPPEISGKERFLENAFEAFVERRKNEIRAKAV